MSVEASRPSAGLSSSSSPPSGGAADAARSPMGTERILRHAAAHTFDLGRFDFVTPIDRSRLWVCPTLTPLHYAEVHRQLSAAQARRYNQLTALCFGELIAFFEASFGHALLALRGDGALPADLRECVGHFIDEEAKHREMWRRLALLSEPTWYADRTRVIVRLPAATRAGLRWLAGRPARFPVVVWLMLSLEEHSIEISRRCARLSPDAIEPRYASVYRAHAEEESRHVQVDWHLLLHLFGRATLRQRRWTGWLFDRAIDAFFLRPTRAAVRVIDALLVEEPSLRPLRATMLAQLRALDGSAPYRAMMLSPESTPITVALRERFLAK